jgi:NADH-quinone oxidoreductase subunit C
MSTESQPTPQAEAPALGTMGEFLKEHGIKAVALPPSTGTETLEVNSKDLDSALRLLRSSSEVKLDFLVAVSGVDQETTFDSVYHLWSFENNNELVVKVRVPKADVLPDRLPEVPSIAGFWPAANWHERESYDLIGIRYYGHPYLRRILNPWDWQGHPLRRDYKQPVDALNDKNPDSFR